MALHDEWNRVYTTLPPGGGMRGYTPHSTPYVPHPTCPEHCSGKHRVEGVLRCDKCKSEAYRVISHEWPWTEGHHWTEFRPANGAPRYDAFGPMICPLCGGGINRR